MEREHPDVLVLDLMPVSYTHLDVYKRQMLPKVQAAVSFAESKPGRTALITLLEKAKDGIAGKTGTRVHQ